MLRMIIADDEKVIRETIRDLIDWNSLGIRVIGLCKNGIEAYDMILDEYPDIVLTDINMPGLSGLALIRRLKGIAQNIQFVILSGYGDYAYTKEAMKLGIQHYLLKPCNEQEITEVMREVKTLCAQARLRTDQQEQNLLMLRRLQESVIHNLLLECFAERPDFAGIACRYERFLSFTNVGYEICALPAAQGAAGQAWLAAFAAYHEQHAPAIPFYCIRADDTLFLGFESYDYDYGRLDAALAAPGYARYSYPCLNDLLPDMHTLLRSHRRVELGAERPVPVRFSQETPACLPGECEDPIDRVEALVREHLSDEELSLKQISEKYLYMNVDYVSRRFLKKTGRKFSAFLAETRIERAKNLLGAGGVSINAVAEAVGCGNNPQYFSQLFKRVTGVTPTEYIRTRGGSRT